MKKRMIIGLSLCFVIGLMACKQAPVTENHIHTEGEQKNTKSIALENSTETDITTEDSKPETEAVTNNTYPESLSMVHQADGLHISETIKTPNEKQIIYCRCHFFRIYCNVN